MQLVLALPSLNSLGTSLCAPADPGNSDTPSALRLLDVEARFYDKHGAETPAARSLFDVRNLCD